MIQNMDRIEFDAKLYDDDKHVHDKPSGYVRIADDQTFIGLKMREAFHIALPSKADAEGHYDFTSDDDGNCPCYHGGTIGGKAGDYVLLNGDGMVIGCAALDPKDRSKEIFKSKFREA